jgi:hypothetical protein
MISIAKGGNSKYRTPQTYWIKYNSSKRKFIEVLVFKLKPQDVGILYNNFYYIDINQVNTEINMEFERSLALLCKLDNHQHHEIMDLPRDTLYNYPI